MEYLVINLSITLMVFFFMKTTYGVFHFQLINSRQNISLDNKQNELYVTKDLVDLKINCWYSVNKEISPKVNCPEIFWQCNERRFENRNKSLSHCLSILHIERIWWIGKQTFFCIYKGYKHKAEKVVENETLVIISGAKPNCVPQLSIQWIEDVVEITWVPNRNNNSMTETKYSVEYYVPPKNDQNKKTILPSLCGIFPTNCSHTTEYYCSASFLPRLMTSYNVKLVAENKFGKTVGKNMKVDIPLSQQKMMLKPVKELRVFLTKSGVRMKWTGVLYYVERKKVWYKCQGTSIINRNFTESNIYDIFKDRLPVFTYCRFCVSRQRYRGGQFSCEKCKVIRTAEDVPKGIPKLKSCQHGSCPFARFGGFRNVTISWGLPQKRLWNGVIRRQVIFYYEENERMLQNVTVIDYNVTTWTLNKLKTSTGYYVFMVLCTNAGCGRKSNDIYIPGLIESSVSFELQFFSDKANTGLVIGLTLGILGLCFAFTFVLLYFKRTAVERLPTLQEPQVARTPDEQEESQSSPLQEYEQCEVISN